MKVYIVVCLDWSSSEVETVFFTKVSAERYVTNQRHPENYEIVEMEVKE